MAVARSIWSGSISFGLVNIPVKLFTAVREDPVRFHMLHDQDKVRLQRRMVCPVEDKEVHPEHIVKGYEIAPDTTAPTTSCRTRTRPSPTGCSFRR